MSEKQLVVFDGDDTLWSVEHLYDKARDRAASIVAAAGVDPHRWDELQRGIDVANVRTLGLTRLRFPHSSVQAYERAASEAGVAVDDATREQVRLASASVFDAVAPLVPGARPVLEELARTHRLALLTQGDPTVQTKRIDDSGLADSFEIVRIVDRKGRASFRAVLADAGVDALDAWSVGNSLPSDINPALELGMGAVWVDAHVWAHERREVAPADGHLLACAALTNVPAVIGQRPPRWGQSVALTEKETNE